MGRFQKRRLAGTIDHRAVIIDFIPSSIFFRRRTFELAAVECVKVFFLVYASLYWQHPDLTWSIDVVCACSESVLVWERVGEVGSG